MRQHWRNRRILNFGIDIKSKSTYPIQRTRDGSTTTMKSLLLIPVALGTLFLASCATAPITNCCGKCEKACVKCEKSGCASCKTCKP